MDRRRLVHFAHSNTSWVLTPGGRGRGWTSCSSLGEVTGVAPLASMDPDIHSVGPRAGNTVHTSLPGDYRRQTASWTPMRKLASDTNVHRMADRGDRGDMGDNRSSVPTTSIAHRRVTHNFRKFDTQADAGGSPRIDSRAVRQDASFSRQGNRSNVSTAPTNSCQITWLTSSHRVARGPDVTMPGPSVTKPNPAIEPNINHNVNRGFNPKPTYEVRPTPASTPVMSHTNNHTISHGSAPGNGHINSLYKRTIGDTRTRECRPQNIDDTQNNNFPSSVGANTTHITTHSTNEQQNFSNNIVKNVPRGMPQQTENDHFQMAFKLDKPNSLGNQQLHNTSSCPNMLPAKEIHTRDTKVEQRRHQILHKPQKPIFRQTDNILQSLNTPRSRTPVFDKSGVDVLNRLDSKFPLQKQVVKCDNQNAGTPKVNVPHKASDTRLRGEKELCSETPQQTYITSFVKISDWYLEVPVSKQKKNSCYTVTSNHLSDKQPCIEAGSKSVDAVDRVSPKDKNVFDENIGGFKPRWKRNSLKLATHGYTSMSDLAGSIDCLDIMPENKDAHSNRSNSISYKFEHKNKHTNSALDVVNRKTCPSTTGQINYFKLDIDVMTGTPGTHRRAELKKKDNPIKRESFRMATSSPIELTYDPGSKDPPSDQSDALEDSVISSSPASHRLCGGCAHEKDCNVSLRTESSSISSDSGVLVTQGNHSRPSSRTSTEFRERQQGEHTSQDKRRDSYNPHICNECPSLSSLRISKMTDGKEDKKLKRNSLKLATSSMTDLNLSFEERDLNISSDQNERDRFDIVRRRKYTHPINVYNTPDSERKYSPASSLSSGRNSSFGSFYSCQSLSSSQSPRSSPSLHMKSLNSSPLVNSAPRRITSPSKLLHNVNNDDNNSTGGSPLDSLDSPDTSICSNANISNDRVNVDSSSEIIDADRYTDRVERLSAVPASRKSPYCRPTDTPYNLYRAFSGKRFDSKRSYNDIPYESNTCVRRRRYSSSSNESDKRKHTHYQKVREVTPTNSASLVPCEQPPVFNSRDYSTDHSEVSPEEGDYTSFKSSMNSLSDIEDEMLAMPTSPPSLGRPKRKQYAGFDSQPLPIECFLSDSSSVYTAASCSSRAPSRSVDLDNSYRGSDWSIDMSGNMRGATSMMSPPYYRNESQTNETSNVPSVYFFNNQGSKPYEESMTSTETIVDDRTTTSDDSKERNTRLQHFSNSIISQNGENNDLSQRVNCTSELAKPPSSPCARSDHVFEYSEPDRSRDQVCQSREQMCRSRASSDSSIAPLPSEDESRESMDSRFLGSSSAPIPRRRPLSRSRHKFFSSRDIIDLLVTSDGPGTGSKGASSLASLEKQAQKVARVILCCKDMEHVLPGKGLHL